MGAARFVGRVGGLAVALGVGVAVFSGPGAAWADSTGEEASGGGAPAGRSGAPSATSSGEGSATPARSLRGSSVRAARSQDPSNAGGATTSTAPSSRASVARIPSAPSAPSASTDRQAAVAVAVPAAESDPVVAGVAAPEAAAPISAAVQSVAPAPADEPEPAAAPAGAVSGFASVADGGTTDGAGTDPLMPAGASLAWALAAVARRDTLTAASVAAPAAQVTVGQEQTNNGVTADPTVEFVDGIIQGALNATSASGNSLTYTFVEGSNGGKLDIGTVPIPGGTDPQSFTVLPYANWLDAGGSKGTETFSVRITEETGFTQFITSIPLVGLLAEPIIGLLQRTPFVSTLLAPLIGGSLLATIDVDVSALAPGDTPLAFTYDVTSFDDVKISTNFFPASGIQAGETAPTVLNGPGLGSAGETDPYNLAGTFGSVPGVAVIRDEGYNIITWDPRGEFASGGVLQLDNPFFEGRDTSAIVSWSAENPLVELNAPDDPAVGMIGGSYGGGIQMVTAATDPRIDAIIPNGNWYSLMDALYPSEAFKSAWSVLLLLDLVEAGARINNQIYEGVFTGLLGGFLTDTSQAVLTSSGPTSLLNQMQAPTLLFQGTVDALFPLDQSVLNAETITANPWGTPVKLGWFCGGHGACTTGTGATLQAQQVQLFADTLAWLDTYVAGDGSAADAVPVFQWWDQKVDRYTSDLLPFEPGFNKPDPYTATDGGGTLGIFPIIGGSGPGSSVAFPISLIFPTQAGNAINVGLTPATGEQIVGAPQLSFTYSGLGTSNAVYAQFIDNATGAIVGNNVTAVPVILDGRERTVSVSLNDIAYTVGAGDSLTLQITDWSSIFFNAGIGFVDISNIQIDLPLRAIPTSVA